MNDLMSRKDFFSKTIKSLALLSATLIINKSSKTTKFFTSNKDFVKGSPRLFHHWYCHHFFDFDQVFNVHEKRFSNLCMDLMDDWSYKMTPSVYLSLMSYSHKVSPNHVNSTRLALGSLKYRHKIHRDLIKVIESKGINTHTISGLEFACGLGWDIDEDLFKIYMFYPVLDLISDSELKHLFNFPMKEGLLNSFGLVSYTFKDTHLYEKKVYSTLKDKTSFFISSKEPQNITWMMTNRRGVVQQLDVSNPFYYYGKVNVAGQRIMDLHKKQGFDLDSIVLKNKDEFTLYF